MRDFSKHYRFILIAILFLGVAVVWSIVISQTNNSILTVSMLDIGQGDSILIESPEKIQVLVDGGPNRKVLSALGKEIPFYDRSLDLLVVSNSDKDHLAGFIDILQSYKIGAVLISSAESETSVFKTFIDLVEEKNIPIIYAYRGQKINIGGGAYIEVLFPDRNVSGLETNTGSIIMKLVYGESSMIFTGDAPSSVEDYVASLDGANLKSDILKVAHHGSKTSISESFLGLVGAQFAAVSVGAKNTYGHPNSETLDALKQFDYKILRTDEIGTITFVSDGKEFVREE